MPVSLRPSAAVMRHPRPNPYARNPRHKNALDDVPWNGPTATSADSQTAAVTEQTANADTCTDAAPAGRPPRCTRVREAASLAVEGVRRRARVPEERCEEARRCRRRDSRGPLGAHAEDQWRPEGTTCGARVLGTWRPHPQRRPRWLRGRLLMLAVALSTQAGWTCCTWSAQSADLQAEGISRLLLIRMPAPNPPPQAHSVVLRPRLDLRHEGSGAPLILPPEDVLGHLGHCRELPREGALPLRPKWHPPGRLHTQPRRRPVRRTPGDQRTRPRGRGEDEAPSPPAWPSRRVRLVRHPCPSRALGGLHGPAKGRALLQGHQRRRRIPTPQRLTSCRRSAP